MVIDLSNTPRKWWKNPLRTPGKLLELYVWKSAATLPSNNPQSPSTLLSGHLCLREKALWNRDRWAERRILSYIFWNNFNLILIFCPSNPYKHILILRPNSPSLLLYTCTFFYKNIDAKVSFVTFFLIEIIVLF